MFFLLKKKIFITSFSSSVNPKHLEKIATVKNIIAAEFDHNRGNFWLLEILPNVDGCRINAYRSPTLCL